MELKESSRDMPGAVSTIEIINHEGAILRHHRRPGVTEVAVAAVLAQDDLRRRRGACAFGIKHPRPHPKWRVTIAIDQQHALVREADGVMRVALKTGVLPLETASAIFRPCNDRVVVEAFRSHESDQIAFGRLIKRGFVEFDL